VALSGAATVEDLLALGVGCATGVPCSWLAPLTTEALAGGRLPYVPAASEGEAIGIAAGSWLGGRLAAVLIQNSGLGNAVNPLTSLAATYELPMLLVVSHRGRVDGDAPQHRLMGAITEPLLELMQIPTRVLPNEPVAAREVLAAAVADATARSRPAAVIVPRGTVAPADQADALPAKHARPVTVRVEADAPAVAPTRAAALATLAGALRVDDLVISTTGMVSRELAAAGDRDATFPMMGSMGCASALALGVALAAPARRVVVVDGDGALLMKAGALATIGAQLPGGLLHLVLDNGCYESTGGQPSASANVDFAALAAASGYARAATLGGASDLARLVSGFAVGDGPALAALAVQPGREAGTPRVPRTPQALRDGFREAVLGPALVP
jgi:phosphonopyruvate decarboxylase